MAWHNRIGKGLMEQKAIELTLGSMECEMCAWLEAGYRTAAEPGQAEAYATEILLHRRAMHIATADHVN